MKHVKKNVQPNDNTCCYMCCLAAASTSFLVKVKTGTVWGAGTDANVYVELFGEIDHSDKMFLKSSLTNKNKFESGKTDEFRLEAVNIGELKKIK